VKPLGIYTFEISVSLLNVAGISKVLVRRADLQRDYVGLLFFFFFKLEEIVAKQKFTEFHH